MTFMLNGKNAEYEPGMTIMQAARANGVEIPGLCYSEKVEPESCCRLCMVDIEERGRGQMVAACSYKVSEGMTVETETENVMETRRAVLKLIKLQSPDSPEIEALMERCGADEPKGLPVKDSGGCMLCGLCAEACKATGCAAISTVGRGVTKRVSTPYDEPAQPCMGCGACAEICPVKCIEVTDDENGRTIWNKHFEWVRCSVCGAIVATKEEYQRSGGVVPVLCEAHRRRVITDELARTYGEG